MILASPRAFPALGPTGPPALAPPEIDPPPALRLRERQAVDALEAPGRASEPLAPGAISLRTLVLEGGPELLIPSHGGAPREIFTRYLDALAAQCDFDWGKSRYGERYGDEAIDALRELEPRAFEKDTPDSRPAVAVILTMPGMLIPGEVAKTFKTVARLERMGCRPVLIPPLADALFSAPAERDRVLTQMARLFDGAIGQGGYDIHPGSYGEDHPHSQNGRRVLDAFEMRFFEKLEKAEAFLFGICRTHQIWNVAQGASMVPDLREYGLSSFQDQVRRGVPPDRVMILADDAPEALLDPSRRFVHSVYLKPGSRMAEAAETDRLVTNAVNHQSVDLDRPARGLEVTAVTVDPVTQQWLNSGTEDWKTLTVQFHPELTEDDQGTNRLLEALGRRAHIFRIVKQLRAEGESPTPNLIAERMAKLPQIGFRPSDWAWLQRDLGPRLRESPIDWDDLTAPFRVRAPG